jgi:hypothetical protein
MKSYIKFLGIATVVCMLACTAQTTSDCKNSNAREVPSDSDPNKFGSPTEISEFAKMTTVIGPLAPNLTKWGPDEVDQPFSWPGRVVQKEPTNPSNPSEQLIYEIRLPEHSLLYKVHVWVDPANVHVDVPASRVGTMLWIHNGGMVESEAIANAQTMGDLVKNYEQRYLLTMELAEPYEMRADTRVFVYVFGEWGKDFAPGLAVDTPEVLFDQ